MTLYEYFQANHNYFWQWEYDNTDDNEVISIPYGNTIVYKKMVVDIIDKLSLQGTPYFGSLLLLIIATNPNSENDFERVREIVSFQLMRQGIFTNGNEQIFLQAIAFLELISQIPKEYKVGANRILLFQTLIRKSHNFLSYKKIRPIVKLIQSKRYEQEQLISPIIFQEATFVKDFRPISLLAKKFFTVEEIIAQMGDLLPIEEELLIENTNTDEKPKLDFVEELIENTNTFHVGTLLKRIWSGLNIPFHNVLPSQQPIGGVSDLTNKGNFDRLLISEFANDDIVFLSRIANNEALYINREVPPQSEDLERIILIDVSIKNWGTPKLLAHALLLAIAKHPKSSIHCTAYAVGETYQPLNFDTIHEIIKSVQYLEGCLEASNGLSAFFNDNLSNKNNEIFFVTTTDAVKSAAVQKVLSDNHSAINYWIYTDAEGKIDLFKKQHNSRKHIQTLKLPLEDLWTKKPKNEIIAPIIPIVPKNQEEQFYNILFPKQNKMKSSLSISDGQIFHIVEKYILREVGEKRGWLMIYDQVPIAQAYEIGLMESGEIILLCYNNDEKKLTLINLTTKFRSSIDFDWSGTSLKFFIFYENSFHLRKGLSTFQFKLTDKIDIFSSQAHQSVVSKIYLNRREELTNLKKRNSFASNTFKNINKVFINSQGNLSINAHEFVYDQNCILLRKMTYNQVIVQAEAISEGKNIFVFSNNHTVTVNRLGMLILSHQTLDGVRKHIFLPTVMDSPLGVATDFYSAGNTFYRSRNNSEKYIETSDFWKEYLQPFIKEITDYEANHRTISSK